MVDKGDFVNTGPLSCDSVFNTLARAPGAGPTKSLE